MRSVYWFLFGTHPTQCDWVKEDIVSGFYCDVKPNICMKKDQKVVQRPVPDAYEFFWIPFSQRAVYNENSIFEQMAVPVIQSVSNPAPLILLWLFPEAYPCVARNEFYKTMSCLISPRPPRRDHTSLNSPLPHPLSMHFKAQVRRKVTNFCIKPQLFGFKQ